MTTKQVIVIRKDLKMRRGKEIAQGSHASLAFLTSRLEKIHQDKETGPAIMQCELSAQELAWIQNSFKKVTLQVNSEEELLNIYQAALDAGLETHLITDSGFTEFNGIPTKTCIAIGPAEEALIDDITGDLELY